MSVALPSAEAPCLFCADHLRRTLLQRENQSASFVEVVAPAPAFGALEMTPSGLVSISKLQEGKAVSSESAAVAKFGRGTAESISVFVNGRRAKEFGNEFG